MKTTLESFALSQAALPKTAADAERLQVMTLVEQFEGMLLTEMLRDVRAGDDEDGGFGLGASTMTDTMQGEFGLALSKAGGLGMGEMLAKTLLKKVEDAKVLELSGTAAPTSAAAALPVTTAAPAGAPAPAADHDHDHPVSAVPTGAGLSGVVAEPVPVSSGFGWRSDPFTGQARFHHCRPHG